MSMSLTIIVNTDERSFDLDQDELSMIEAVAKNNSRLQDAMLLLFGSSHDGRGRRVYVKEIQKAASVILTEARSSINDEVYSVSGKFSDGTPFIGARGVSGMRIKDEHLMIQGGRGKCQLIKMRASAQGRGEIVSTEDIRHLREIETDNMGKISIRVRTKPRRIVRVLHQLQKALETLSADSEIVIDVG